MSSRDRGRQQTFSRILSWAGVAAPPRGPSQRQPSQVTTTLAQPQPPAAQDQPPLPPQTQHRQPPLPPPLARAPAPSRRSSQTPPSSQAKPQMGPAPSRPASDTRPPWTPATARAPPTSSPSDTAPPRSSQPGDGTAQPTRRVPSRQLSRTYAQPPSPSRPPAQTAPRRPSPSPPPPPTASPAQLTSPTEPKAPSKTPSPAPTPPPAVSRPLSPPAKPPSPQIQPASPKEIPEVPSLSSTAAPGSPPTKALQLEPVPTEQKEQIKKEAAATSPPANLQPQETSQEKDQTPVDSASMPVEVASQPPIPEAGDAPPSSVTPTVPYPAPETQPDETGDQLPPTTEMGQKQTQDTTEPPKPEPEPEGKVEEKLVIGAEADQKSDPGLSQAIDRNLEATEEEHKPVNPPKPDQESDPDRWKNIETRPEELKEETPKTSPGPRPDENTQIKDHQETTTNMVGTKLTPLEQPQMTGSQETTNLVEKTKQTSQEPNQQPIQVHIQPIKEVNVSEAQQPDKQAPPPEKEPAPPSNIKGKEGNIAISTVARTSTSSREEQSGSLHKEIKEGISRLVQNLAVQHTKQTGGGQGISIITLAGDNHGASMYVGYGTTNRERNNNVIVHKGPSPIGGDAGDTAGEDRQKKTEQQLSPTTEANASVNSNVQAINNSILHDSSTSEENPGVHLVLSTKPLELAQQKETAKPAQLQKPRTRPPLIQKLTQEPTVRRRCLRGLFLESSDDDPEKPRKARRHGCRFSCDEKKKNGPTGDTP